MLCLPGGTGACAPRQLVTQVFKRLPALPQSGGVSRCPAQDRLPGTKDVSTKVVDSTNFSGDGQNVRRSWKLKQTPGHMLRRDSLVGFF